MKLAKKILVAVLALALLASCFVSMAFATDSSDRFRAEGITKIDDILEYYSCDSYIAENYEKAEDAGYSAAEYDSADGSGYPLWTEKNFTKREASSSKNKVPVTTEVVANPTDASDKVLHIITGYNDHAKYVVASEDKADLPKMVYFTFDIYFPETAESNTAFQVDVKTEGNNTMSLIKFVFEGATNSVPVLEYAPWAPTAGNFGTSVVYDGFTPATEVWYYVEVCYNAEDEVCSFLIYEGDNSEPVVNMTYDAPGAKGLEQVECIAKLSNNSKARNDAEMCAEMYVDDLEIYEGSYKRIPSEKETITTTTLLDLENIYLATETSDEDRLAVADVFYELITLNGGEFAAEVSGVVENVRKYVNNANANEVINRVAAINADADYPARLDWVVNSVDVYDAKLPAGTITELEGVSADVIEQINAARVILADEKAALAIIDQHSSGFIEAVKVYSDFMADPASAKRDYFVIENFYKEISKDDYAKRTSTYPNITDSLDIFAELEAKYTRMKNDVTNFMSYVDAMKTKETFGTLYPEYVKAKVAYYQYDEMPEFAADAFINPDFDESTHPEFAAKKAEFETLAIDIEKNIEACNAFNMQVLLASSSDYYDVFKKLVEAAEEMYDVIKADFDYLKDYIGYESGKTLEDTYNLYSVLKQSVTDKKSATDLYIEAVKAIADAQGFYAKREAVNNAMALKAAGDNLAVAGVKEANLALSAAAAEINELQGNSESVITLVAELEAAETIAERRQLVNMIAKYLGEDNANVAMDFVGVTAAIIAYNTEKAELAADIAAVNEALNNAVKNAVKLA